MPEYRNDYFYCSIDKNGNIIDIDKRIIVGINSEYADELREKIRCLEDITEEWRPYMVKHGYIEEPKAPEDLIKEQNNVIEKQTELINKLSEQVENLTFIVGRIINEQSVELRNIGGNSKGESRVSVKDGRKSSGNKNSPARDEKLHIESGELSIEQQA